MSEDSRLGLVRGLDAEPERLYDSPERFNHRASPFLRGGDLVLGYSSLQVTTAILMEP